MGEKIREEQNEIAAELIRQDKKLKKKRKRNNKASTIEEKDLEQIEMI